MKSNNFETIVTVGLSPFMTPVVVRITTPWMRFQQLKTISCLILILQGSEVGEDSSTDLFSLTSEF